MAGGAFDLNQPAASDDEAANQRWSVERSHSDTVPPAPPSPPPRQRGQAHRQRGRQSDSLDSDSPAPKRRRVSNQPRPPSVRRPPHSFSGRQEPQHEVSSEGSNNVKGHTTPSQFTPLQPSGSGGPPSSSPPPVATSAVPSRSDLRLNVTAAGFQTMQVSLESNQASTAFSLKLRKDED